MALEDVVSSSEIKIQERAEELAKKENYKIVLLEEKPFRQAGTSIKYWM